MLAAMLLHHAHRAIAHLGGELRGLSHLGSILKRRSLLKTRGGSIRHHTVPLVDDVYKLIAGVVHIASWRARVQEMSISGDELKGSYPG
jgi:hypothetical protein